MKPRTFGRLLSRASIAALATCSSVSAQAQESSEPTEDTEVFELQDIIITGEKVDRTIRETASSVSVITSEDLEAKPSVADVREAVEGTPNVIYPATVGAPVIRGQEAQGPNTGAGAFFGGTVPRATVNLDGHYLSYNELVFGANSVWDVGTIEVFRGPQTTSQGANSIAGAIIVNTKDPTFYKEGAAQLQFGSDNRKRASLAYSAPLSEQFAARIALDYYSRDTFIDYTNPRFAHGATNQDFESKNARVKFLWSPTDIPGLTAKFTYSYTDTNRPTTEAADSPFNEPISTTASNPSWGQRTNTAIADIGYEFANGIAIVNQLQYTDLDVDRVSEPANFGSAQIDQTNLSNELRLTFGSEKSAIDGVVGIYAARTDSDEALQLRGDSIFDDRKDNLGIFTDITYRFAERWSLTGGLRFQQDKIKRTGTSNLARDALDYNETFSDWLPRLSLAYDITDTATVGALISKGYNPGGVSLNFRSGEYVPFEKETVWNYELFGRAQLLDNSLFLTGNLFYSDFTDAQRFVVVSIPGLVGQAMTVNAEKAKSYGLEVGLDYRPIDTLRLTGGLGLLRTEVTEFTSASVDFLGNEFSNSPSYMLTLGADWDFAPDWTLGGTVRFTDGYFSTDDNDPQLAVSSYTVADLRLSYRPRDDIEVFGYVNNLFDERGPTLKRTNRTIGGVEGELLEPRYFGFGVRKTF
ncbi:TonB-dependent receptor [Ruegeria sp. Ofav3-42]|uniref:TonB-dependent receptor n=1 Tax=Ruegeria sp. Ofav3-42 TaxID=2917759 RepID=UPI001EF68101|nr:TonB-dependent receptor [Ruegeria sp. Ofav3-42]MCG7519847.1 TonB-dependent receptor [Ruegeria sp. Ofav3-42]